MILAHTTPVRLGHRFAGLDLVEDLGADLVGSCVLGVNLGLN